MDIEKTIKSAQRFIVCCQAPLPGSWKGAPVRRETLVEDVPS